MNKSERIDLEQLKFYSTSAHDCSYLEGESATTVFLDPNVTISKPLYSQLLELGFRRSGDHVYRPHCANCQACISVRIPCQQFTPKRSQKRIINKNKDISAERVNSIDNDECYALFENYIEQRHSDGDMHPTSRADYRSFLCGQSTTVCYYRFSIDNRLVAVAISDQVDDGLSAIYSFFDTDLNKRSLGGYIILWQIEECLRLGLSHLYLGYWIKSCQKMSYKSLYRPLELYINQQWQRLN